MLQPFQSFEQISDHLVNTTLDTPVNSAAVKEMCGNLLQSPVSVVNHYTMLGLYLNQLHQNDHLTDVLLDVQRTKFNAHRSVLCCHSEYFADMLSGRVIAKVPFELRVTGISAAAFRAFLEFCYSGNLNVTPKTATDILVLVDFLKVTTLKNQMGAVYDNIPLVHVLKLLMGNKVRPGELFHKMYWRVENQFSAASKLEGFLDMNAELFCQFLASGKRLFSPHVHFLLMCLYNLFHLCSNSNSSLYL